jgi:membrane peptidoglycan carboxypeptidase
MTGIMEQVVERGTGTPAKMPGYTIAAKTGTANKLINGRYSNETFASFVGFLPSNDPKVAILVVLDSPHGNNGHFGGPVSAPIFKRIAEEAVRYLGIPLSINPAAPVLVAGNPTTPGVPTSLESVPAPPVDPDEPGTVPDVRGMSAHDAVIKLTKFGLEARVQGTGFVTSQDPVPGTPLDEARVCLLTLERGRVRQSASAKLP